MFKTPYIRIHEQGIDIIKHYQIKKHVDFLNIQKIKIEQGNLINNWILVLVLGLFLTFTSSYWGSHIISSWDLKLDSEVWTRKILILIFFVPWILSTAGILLVILSFKKSKKLIIESNNKIFRISIKEIEKEKRIDELIDFLKDRAPLTSN